VSVRGRYRHYSRSMIYSAAMRILLRVYSLVSRPVCAGKAARYRRGRKTPARAPLPILSIGNLTLGGEGKTPLACEIIAHFLRKGWRPALVSRGYRGAWERSGGVVSDGKTFFGGFREAGDEPVLVARRYPRAGVFVGRGRLASCRAAASLGFDFCVLDDAFQRLDLARDLDIVLHDPRSSSPRREGDRALARADVLLLPRGTSPERFEAYRRRFPRLKVFEYAAVPRGLFSADGQTGVPLEALSGKRVLAFAGIARPRRFFSQLESLGAAVVGRMTFPDHHLYPAASRARIAAAVSRTDPEMVLTTEKDAVKFEAGELPWEGPGLTVLRIGLDLPDEFFECLEAAVFPGKAGHA